MHFGQRSGARINVDKDATVGDVDAARAAFLEYGGESAAARPQEGELRHENLYTHLTIIVW